MIEFTLNGQPASLDAAPDMPLLWALRELAGLTGTKFGCGIGACGACTVHLNGAALRACVVPVQAVAGQRVTTIEGLAATAPDGAGGLHRVQAQWLAEQVPQCGYCQSGMIMAVSALLAEMPQPDDAAIDRMLTNLCRCGTHERIRRAIHALAASAPLLPAEAAGDTDGAR